MALVTRQCLSRGALVIFTFNDVTLRTTQVAWIGAATFVVIRVFDNDGTILADINVGRDTSPMLVDAPVHQCVIQKSDGTVKTFFSPLYAVYF